MPFFKRAKLSIHYFSFGFAIKIIAGFALTWVYSSHYSDRSTADIYKYYDDAKYMYAALETEPSDYVKMVCSVGNDNPKFDSLYYSKMNHWFRKYDYGVYNDNHTMIRFNALVMPFSFGSFHVHTVVMCFISFLGLFAMFLFFQPLFADRLKLLFVALFLLPSVLFWGSGVLKEGILLFSLGFLMYYSQRLAIERAFSIKNMIFIVLSISLFLINKSYLLYIIFPSLLIYFFIEIYKWKRIVLVYAVILCSIFSAAYLSRRVMTGEDLMDAFVLKQRDFINLSKGGVFLLNEDRLVRIESNEKYFLDSLANDQFKIKGGANYLYWNLNNFNDTLKAVNSNDSSIYKLVWDLPVAGSVVNIKPLQSNILSFIAGAPMAYLNVLVQPLFWKADSLTAKMAALENSLIIGVLIMSIFIRRRGGINLNLITFCILASTLLFLLIGFTTPVVGAIVRYKIPFLPLLVLIGFHLIDLEKLKRIRIFKKLLK